MRSIIVPLLFFASAGAAQNMPPSVAIVNVVLDQGAGTVTITYDLSDPEGDACAVWISASVDGGTTFLADVSNVTGAVGSGIAPGSGLVATWTYAGIPSIESTLVRVTAEDGHAPDIQSMVDQVDGQLLAERLEQVAILRHHQSAPAGLSAVRDTLWDTFERAGFQRTATPVPLGGFQADNIQGRQPGLVNEASTFIVDAHYDAVAAAPGADDNATGVAATLEIARILSGYSFKHSLRYIGFAFEEQGLIGSQYHVLNATPAWEVVNGVLNMEMIGFYSDAPNSQQVPAGFDILFPTATASIAADEYRGNFLTVVGNTASQPLIDAYLAAAADHVPALRTIALAVPGNGEIAPDLRRSDHAVFWEAGRQALMLTDGSNFRNPNYHTPNDVIGTIDLDFLTNCTKATLAAAARLAEPVNAGRDVYDLANAVGIHEHHDFPCSAEVFPNPVKDRLFIRLGDCIQEQVIAELFDLQGRKIAGGLLRSNGSGVLHELATPILLNGTHLLVLRSGGSVITMKVEVDRP